MSQKNERRIRKVADAVRDAVAEGQAKAMTAFFAERVRVAVYVARASCVGYFDAALRG